MAITVAKTERLRGEFEGWSEIRDGFAIPKGKRMREGETVGDGGAVTVEAGEALGFKWARQQRSAEAKGTLRRNSERRPRRRVAQQARARRTVGKTRKLKRRERGGCSCLALRRPDAEVYIVDTRHSILRTG